MWVIQTLSSSSTCKTIHTMWLHLLVIRLKDLNLLFINNNVFILCEYSFTLTSPFSGSGCAYTYSRTHIIATISNGKCHNVIIMFSVQWKEKEIERINWLYLFANWLIHINNTQTIISNLISINKNRFLFVVTIINVSWFGATFYSTRCFLFNRLRINHWIFDVRIRFNTENSLRNRFSRCHCCRRHHYCRRKTVVLLSLFVHIFRYACANSCATGSHFLALYFVHSIFLLAEMPENSDDEMILRGELWFTIFNNSIDIL